MAQLAGPVELLKSSWEILKERWKTLVAIQLVPVLLIIPIGILGAIFVGVSAVGNLSKLSGGDYEAALALFKIFGPVLIVLVLLSVFIQVWTGVALIYAIRDWKEGVGFKESYRRAWRILRSYLWVSVLAGLSVLGGFMLLVIPGLIFAVWFGFAGYVVIDQGTKGVEALRTSKELVKGRFWGVVWRFLVVGFLGLILVSVGEYLDQSWKDTPMAWVGGLGTLVVSLLWTAYSGVYIWLLYSSLRSTTNKSE